MNILENIQAVIFDFDGTLYNSKGIEKNLILKWPYFFSRMLADRNARNSIKGTYFGSFDALFDRYALEISKRTLISADKVKLWNRNIYMPGMVKLLRKKYTARPHLVELFNSLEKKGIKLAVFSDYGFVKERLDALGIPQNMLSKELQSHIYNAEDLGGLKPTKDPFLNIARDLNTAPKNVLVIGDRNDTDGEGARASGMNFVLLKTHKTKELPPDFAHPFLSWDEVLTELMK